MTDNLLCATVSVRGVILDSRGRVLTLQRTTDGKWELPGGRLGRGEQTQKGLCREIHEETSLTVEVNDIVKANSWINTEGQGRFAVHYLCSTTERTVDLSEEHVDSAWRLPEETAQVLRDPQTAAVHAATSSRINNNITNHTSPAQD